MRFRHTHLPEEGEDVPSQLQLYKTSMDRGNPSYLCFLSAHMTRIHKATTLDISSTITNITQSVWNVVAVIVHMLLTPHKCPERLKTEDYPLQWMLSHWNLVFHIVMYIPKIGKLISVWGHLQNSSGIFSIPTWMLTLRKNGEKFWTEQRNGTGERMGGWAITFTPLSHVAFQ